MQKGDEERDDDDGEGKKDGNGEGQDAFGMVYVQCYIYLVLHC